MLDKTCSQEKCLAKSATKKSAWQNLFQSLILQCSVAEKGFIDNMQGARALSAIPRWPTWR